MPTSFLSADSSFPRLTADVPAEERLNRVQSYLYLLLEQLRYILSNLGEENFNETSLKAIERAITEPIMQTVDDLAGNVSTLEQTAASLTTRIGNAEGDISSLEQTAASLVTRVTNAEGDISTVSQTADKINWVVASGTSAATMTLTQEAIDLVAQGINIAGYVTFSSLETAGQSVINGNNILLESDATGTSGSYLAFLNEQGHGYGQLWTKDMTGDMNPYMEQVMFTMEGFGGVDNKTCGLLLDSGANTVIRGSYVNLDAMGQIVLTGALPTLIEGTAGGGSSTPTGFYSFCSDGIYYGNRRILAI